MHPNGPQNICILIHPGKQKENPPTHDRSAVGCKFSLRTACGKRAIFANFGAIKECKRLQLVESLENSRSPPEKYKKRLYSSVFFSLRLLSFKSLPRSSSSGLSYNSWPKNRKKLTQAAHWILSSLKWTSTRSPQSKRRSSSAPRTLSDHEKRVSYSPTSPCA